MMWSYWIGLYTQMHCVARGLRPLTIRAYENALTQFRAWVKIRVSDIEPRQVTARNVLEYIEYLRTGRDNGASAVNRHVIILRNFYRAMVAMGYLEPDANPMAHFPKIKATPRKLPVVLSQEEVRKLLAAPPTDTIIGVRDRAILTLLYGTGVRASECAGLTVDDVDMCGKTIRVTGKGGHQRTIPLNDSVVKTLGHYVRARGMLPPTDAFFRSMRGKAMSRGAIYERVRTHARRAGLHKCVSPHKLRHTFATHLAQAGVNIVTIRDLLGHRLITSTQVYLHVTAKDLEEAAECHPIRHLAPALDDLLPNVKLPFKRPPRRRSG